jgi:hypothetical protein
LRDKREAASDETPRRRIVRSATEDRRGREIAVERVVPVRPNRAPKTTRNARRFGAEREGAPGKVPVARPSSSKRPAGKAPRRKR